MAFTPITTGISSAADCEAHLQLWLNAAQRLTIAQTASMGDRQLTRVDWPEVKDAIQFWTAEKRKFEAAALGAGTPGMKVVKWTT